MSYFKFMPRNAENPFPSDVLRKICEGPAGYEQPTNGLEDSFESTVTLPPTRKRPVTIVDFGGDLKLPPGQKTPNASF